MIVCPDNLLSHRNSWLAALERLVELEPPSTVGSEEDQKGYWAHELQAMKDMYADFDKMASVFTHNTKGGHYIKLGTAQPAGTIRRTAVNPQMLDVYASVPNGQIYYRRHGEFHEAMSPLYASLTEVPKKHDYCPPPLPKGVVVIRRGEEKREGEEIVGVTLSRKAPVYHFASGDPAPIPGEKDARLHVLKPIEIPAEKQHVLYTDADKDRPDQICDSNGQVVLGQCKNCNRAECELDEVPECDFRAVVKHDAHDTHCCDRHGCKYGDEDCPIVKGERKQLYNCEQCEEEIEEAVIHVDPKILHRLLEALEGPAHHIREMQVTCNLPDADIGEYPNPIAVLRRQYNNWAHYFSRGGDRNA